MVAVSGHRDNLLNEKTAVGVMDVVPLEIRIVKLDVDLVVVVYVDFGVVIVAEIQQVIVRLVLYGKQDRKDSVNLYLVHHVDSNLEIIKLSEPVLITKRFHCMDVAVEEKILDAHSLVNGNVVILTVSRMVKVFRHVCLDGISMRESIYLGDFICRKHVHVVARVQIRTVIEVKTYIGELRTEDHKIIFLKQIKRSN